MTFRALDGEFATDRTPILRWLIFTGVCIFGFVLLWHYGLFKLMLVSDRTNISLIICVLYALTTIHCLWRTQIISRESDAAHRAYAIVERAPGKFTVAGQNVVASDGTRLPSGASHT